MLTYYIAFISGLLSFFSPCVFPVMPGYLCFIMSCTPQEHAANNAAWKGWFTCLFVACAFILGFATVFVILGSLASQIHVFFMQYRGVFTKFGATLVILFGLVTLGWLRLPFMEREVRWHPSRLFFESMHPIFLAISSYFVGIAFGLGWTPCIGPILGSILVLAAESNSAQEGIRLLVLYSLGLGIPLLLMAVFFQAFMRYTPGLKKVMPYVRYVSGMLLIVIGVMIWANSLSMLAIL